MDRSWVCLYDPEAVLGFQVYALINMVEGRLTAKQQKAIDKLHHTYTYVLQPLIGPLAKVHQLDINPLYNETRAIFSHLARVHTAQEKAINKEISKAQGHLDRLTLDVFKMYALHFSNELQQFENSYRGVDLSSVDDSRFYSSYFSSKHKAEQELIEAKKLEHQDKEKAYDRYQNTYAAYAGLIAYVNTHLKEIKKRRRKYIALISFKTIVNVVLMFIASCISCYLVTWLTS